MSQFSNVIFLNIIVISNNGKTEGLFEKNYIEYDLHICEEYRYMRLTRNFYENEMKEASENMAQSPKLVKNYRCWEQVLTENFCGSGNLPIPGIPLNVRLFDSKCVDKTSILCLEST